MSAALLGNRKARPLIAALVFCAVSATAAIAMDRGQFANVPLEVREWFEHLRSPNGLLCCSYADGHRTGYDMRQGQYWIPIEGEWYPIPPEVCAVRRSVALVIMADGLTAEPASALVEVPFPTPIQVPTPTRSKT